MKSQLLFTHSGTQYDCDLAVWEKLSSRGMTLYFLHKTPPFYATLS